MSEKDQVKVDIVADPSGLKKGTAEAARDLKKMRDEVNETGKASQEAARPLQMLGMSMRTLGLTALGGAAALGTYAIAMGKLALNFARAAADLGELSEKTALSVEELSLMRLEAQESKLTMDQLGEGYRQLSVKMLEANSGGRQAQALFRALGVEWEDGTGHLRDVRDVMSEVADRFAEMEKGAGKSAIASKLFGRALGDEMIPYLDNGSAKLRAFRKEADDLGYRIDEDTSKAVKRLQASLAALGTSAEGAAGEWATPWIEALDRVINRMRQTRREAGWLRTLQEGAKSLFGELFLPTPRDNLESLLAERERLLASLPFSGSGDRKGIQDRLNALQEQILQAQRLVNLENPEFFREGPRPPRRPAPDAASIERAGAGGSAGGGASRYRMQGEYGSPEYRMEMAEQSLFGEYTRGIELVNETNRKEAQKTFKVITVEGRQAFDDVKAAVDDFGREMARSLARGEEGFRGLKDSASRFLEELLAIQLQKRLVDPALKAGTSYLDSLFAGDQTYMGGGIQVAPDAYGGFAAAFHSGGVAGAGGRMRRMPAGAFAYAPRFHRGGEIPAILQAGEEVLTRRDPRHVRNGGMSAPSVTVNVINQSGQPVRAQTSAPRVDATGMVVDVLLRGLSTNGAAREQLAGMLQRPRH